MMHEGSVDFDKTVGHFALPERSGVLCTIDLKSTRLSLAPLGPGVLRLSHLQLH